MSDTIGMIVLVRDDSRCFRCGVIVLSLDHNCHHRLYASAGGTDEPQNRITLCGFGNNLRGPDGRIWCHGWVHANKAEAAGEGWVISRFDKRAPEEVPVRHWQLGMVLLNSSYGIDQVREDDEE